MNPDPQAWQHLKEAAAAQLPREFADNVIRMARPGRAPSIASQFMLSVATVAVCFIVAVFYEEKISGADSDRVLADWQQIASAADDSGFASTQ